MKQLCSKMLRIVFLKNIAHDANNKILVWVCFFCPLQQKNLDTTMERNTLMAKCYPRIKDYCREKHGLEFQVNTNNILPISMFSKLQ